MLTNHLDLASSALCRSAFAVTRDLPAIVHTTIFAQETLEAYKTTQTMLADKCSALTPHKKEYTTAAKISRARDAAALF